MIFIRSALFYIYLFTVTILTGVISFAIRLFAKKYALSYAKMWAGLCLAGLEKICHISVEVKGKENLPKDSSFLIASQHQSAFDTLVWMNLLPRPAYIMKQELLKIPLVGPMLLLSGMIPLDRQGGIKALKTLIQHCQKAVKDFRQIIIFPEGTRAAVGEKTKLHSGAIAIAKQLNLQIIPVSTNSGRYWSNTTFLKYPGVINITIHPPISDVQDRKAVLESIEHCWKSTYS